MPWVTRQNADLLLMKWRKPFVNALGNRLNWVVCNVIGISHLTKNGTVKYTEPNKYAPYLLKRGMKLSLLPFTRTTFERIL